MVLALGTVLAYLIRFESVEGLHYLAAQWLYPVLSIPLRLGILWLGGIYRVLWRHAGARDFLRLVVVGGLAGAANFALGSFVLSREELIAPRVPLSVLAFGALATVLGPAALRMLERIFFLGARQNGAAGTASRVDRRRRKVLIAGAGEAGRLVAEELRRSGEPVLPVGFLDDAPEKQGGIVAGLPVLGRLAELHRVVELHPVDELVVAMPTAPGPVMRAVAADARQAGLEVRTVPALLELATGRLAVTALRKLRIEDLLRREPVQTDLVAVRAALTGKRVLVTGAGGSIGSELCRQVAALDPAATALLGHGENSIFEIHNELRMRFAGIRLEPMIADIRDRPRLAALFTAFAPEVVFHAAAHKHVPLMEANPVEAVTNNVAGTWNVAELAAAHGAERMVMISTDKAVGPTNVMGASKCVAEQLVQELATAREANFVAVRFGNVLGSRGSVVPTFLRQIEAGGPLTLTHPEVRRFFMTIPEAVQLVLQAAVLGEGGEIFALDMGEAIRIADLADDLIRLSGLEPGRDIEVTYTGLRPGEKLYEEVFFEGDSVEPTAHPKIRRTRATAVPVGLLSVVRLMEERANGGASPEELRAMMRRLVPEFHPEAGGAAATAVLPDRTLPTAAPHGGLPPAPDPTTPTGRTIV